MSLSKKITINTLSQLISKGLTTAIGIIITGLLTRYMGASGFGDYSFVIFVVGTATTIANWGLNLIVVREVAKTETEQGKIIGDALVLRSLLAFVAALTVVLISVLLPRPETLKIALALSSLLILALSIKDAVYAVFMVKLKMENWGISELLASIILLVVAVSVINLKLPLPYLVAGQSFANLCSILLAFSLSKNIIKIEINLPDLKVRLGYIISEALPMGAILVLFTLYNHIDNLMLYAWKGSIAAGVYGLSYKIYDVLTLPAAYLMNSLLPVFSKEAENNKDNGKRSERLRVLYLRSFDILLATGLVLFIIIFIFSPKIILLLSGEKFAEFQDSALILQILGLSNVISFLNHLTGFTIVALRKQKLSFYYASFALVLNISLNIIVIPRLSYFGAALTTIATELSILIMTSVLIYKTIGALPSPVGFYKTLLFAIKTKGKIFD